MTFDAKAVAEQALAANQDPIESVLYALATEARHADGEAEVLSAAGEALSWFRQPGVVLPHARQQVDVGPDQTLVLVTSAAVDDAGLEALAEALAAETRAWDGLGALAKRRRPRTVVVDGDTIRQAFLIPSSGMRRQLKIQDGRTYR